LRGEQDKQVALTTSRFSIQNHPTKLLRFIYKLSKSHFQQFCAKRIFWDLLWATGTSKKVRYWEDQAVERFDRRAIVLWYLF